MKPEIAERDFRARRARGKRGCGHNGMIPVVFLLKRGGYAYIKFIDGCFRAQLQPTLRSKILANGTAYMNG
jgi:hypothetical protein